MTTGIAAVAGSALSAGEHVPAVEPRQQDVEDDGRPGAAAGPARALGAVAGAITANPASSR